MRASELLLRTWRDAPADAEAVSHQLLTRAGYIRRVASGVYAFLPLGQRVLARITAIVREEMVRAGAQEILMPILQPVELWEQSGRRPLLDDEFRAFHVDGRGGRFVLGPTHEEVVTALVSAEVDSYRDLPRNVFQVHTKFRDEARPRFGLVRGREFLMKDGYSFDTDEAGLQRSYEAMHAAYRRVFDRCRVDATPVVASAGAMGGGRTHEFMVPSAIGEDHFARCTGAACDYAANLETAERGAPNPAESHGGAFGVSGSPPDPAPAMRVHHTPDRPGIDAVVEHFAAEGLTAAGMLKCIAMVDGDDRATVVLVPGDREARVPAGLRPFADADFERHPELVKGYIGPMGLRERGVRVVADWTVDDATAWVTGANEADHHVSGAALGRDFTVDERGSYAVVAAGDPCARCRSPLELVRSVEVGHIFQLGLRYSAALPGATFTDADGADRPFWMGCYGIGISRLLAVVAEQHHDDAGLAWPAAVAPFGVHLVALGAARSAEVATAADRIHAALAAAGAEVLYDDRDLSPGVKLADADLIGIPLRVVVGAKGVARGVVEVRRRGESDSQDLPIASAAEGVLAML